MAPEHADEARIAALALPDEEASEDKDNHNMGKAPFVGDAILPSNEAAVAAVNLPEVNVASADSPSDALGGRLADAAHQELPPPALDVMILPVIPAPPPAASSERQQRITYSDPLRMSIDLSSGDGGMYPHLAQYQEHKYAKTCIEVPTDRLQMTRTDVLLRFKQALEKGMFCERSSVSSDTKALFVSMHELTSSRRPQFFIEFSGRAPQKSVSNLLSFAFPSLPILFYPLGAPDDASPTSAATECPESLRANLLEVDARPGRRAQSMLRGSFDCFQHLDSFERFAGGMFPFEFEEYVAAAVCRCNVTWVPRALPADPYFSMWTNSSDLIASAMASTATSCGYRIEVPSDSEPAVSSSSSSKTSGSSSSSSSSSSLSKTTSFSSSVSSSRRRRLTHILVHRVDAAAASSSSSSPPSSSSDSSLVPFSLQSSDGSSRGSSSSGSSSKRSYGYRRPSFVSPEEPQGDIPSSDRLASSSSLSAGNGRAVVPVEALSLQRLLDLKLRPAALASVLSSFAAAREDIFGAEPAPSSSSSSLASSSSSGGGGRWVYRADDEERSARELPPLLLFGDGRVAPLRQATDPSSSSPSSSSAGSSAVAAAGMRGRGSGSRRLASSAGPAQRHHRRLMDERAFSLSSSSSSNSSSSSSGLLSSSLRSRPTYAPTAPPLRNTEASLSDSSSSLQQQQGASGSSGDGGGGGGAADVFSLFSAGAEASFQRSSGRSGLGFMASSRSSYYSSSSSSGGRQSSSSSSSSSSGPDTEWTLPSDGGGGSSEIARSRFLNETARLTAAAESAQGPLFSSFPDSSSGGGGGGTSGDLSLTALGRASLRALRDRERAHLKAWLAALSGGSASDSSSRSSSGDGLKPSSFNAALKRTAIAGADSILVFGR
jgi:hypothetical protein